MSDLMSRFFSGASNYVSILKAYGSIYEIRSVGGNQPRIERVCVYLCKTDIYIDLNLWAARSA